MFDLGPGGPSRLYDRFVIPTLNPRLRILDLGCGRRDYVKSLRKAMIPIIGYEPYPRAGSRTTIDVTTVNRDAVTLGRWLRQKGRFDMVICDRVLNVLRSEEEEDAVLGTLSALCRVGGTVCFSGRHLRGEKGSEKLGAAGGGPDSADRCKVPSVGSGTPFPAEHMAHSEAFVRELTEAYFGYSYTYRRLDAWWYVVASKTSECLAEEKSREALAYEFSLPLPNGKRYEHAPIVISGWVAGRQISG